MSFRVAVSGVGGGAGQSILKALQDSDYEIIGLDGDVLAAGLYACNDARLIPYARDKDFVDRVLDVCSEAGCSLLFPGLDAELLPLSRERERFAAAGITPIVSDPTLVEISDDKLATAQALRRHGFSVPHTVALGDTTLDALPSYPFIVKRRHGGARSRDVYLITSNSEFDRFRSANHDPSAFVIQEYLDGDEYTCGSVTIDGRCRGVVVMRRVLRDGDTYKAFVVRDRRIEDYVEGVMNALKPFGPCNLQLRVRDGEPMAFEINARCSGTSAARALCGFNEPLAIADYVVKGKMPVFDVKEQIILRYWQELAVEYAEVEALTERRTGHRKEAPRL